MAAASYDTGLLLCTITRSRLQAEYRTSAYSQLCMEDGSRGGTGWGPGPRMPMPQDRIGELLLGPCSTTSRCYLEVLCAERKGAPSALQSLCFLPLLENGLVLYAKGVYAAEKGHAVLYQLHSAVPACMAPCRKDQHTGMASEYVLR